MQHSVRLVYPEKVKSDKQLEFCHFRGLKTTVVSEFLIHLIITSSYNLTNRTYGGLKVFKTKEKGTCDPMPGLAVKYCILAEDFLYMLAGFCRVHVVPDEELSELIYIRYFVIT